MYFNLPHYIFKPNTIKLYKMVIAISKDLLLNLHSNQSSKINYKEIFRIHFVIKLCSKIKC